ncbi:type III secretion apparatus lipoprotein, YscJ/HrcJ family [Burkholderia ambifaria AMMD]|uniref:Lipoprotein n=1 Tax=Burkholderia ambifaria (strain ATCC BAA-244 / DSM 16087 / CCUG 44356 / LMG 19182 / AMMD) TaxID=339670 RepID=Q0B373_BURCM|nr:type III secretion inner membrane ring lipoprotein SctJ [Burkholderia ambifaria]ABI91400.1 type III secretion apparatus lipoprotein, YscJ/HrcJ family [Burkholderia ambifaria AMMD]AJY26871.1 type III secretion apparatus lipoprotein, YscJ/HrcJ family [Burkholderia ambifaria AMMD]MBR7932225.1 type III secretion inner membrane ring lipoprotein SctJ [Burkholderia ambifaria]NHL70320.1 type III secretion inner membrane ring lipoprotein SctJ [Burkholderia ambifaria]PEH69805.1 EscJ/YscJ/HrcJ family 
MKSNLVPTRPRASWRLVAAAVLVLSLAACKQDLYGQLSESDCNEMVAALLSSGVDAQKSTPDGGKTWSVSVDEKQIVHAVEVLRARGIPRKKFDDLGSLFKKDGLVSTPTEERVRFIYGLSQELDDTLSKIDGVVVARVQIVLPNNDPLAQSVKPSSASVFIKYRPDANLERMTPAIKNLVVHSIEGLTYDQVSVTSVPADAPDVPARPRRQGGWIVYAGGALGMLLLMIAGGFALLRGTLLKGGGLAGLLARRTGRAAKAPA